MSDAPPLALERTIPLTNTAGRIDHMAVYLARGRLFVAELGNGTTGPWSIIANAGATRGLTACTNAPGGCALDRDAAQAGHEHGPALAG